MKKRASSRAVQYIVWRATPCPCLKLEHLDFANAAIVKSEGEKLVHTHDRSLRSPPSAEYIVKEKKTR